MLKIVYENGPSGKKRYYINDIEVTECEFNSRVPSRPSVIGSAPLPGQLPDCWPKVSMNALAVHPEQVAEANERSVRDGIGVRYERDGSCVIPDKAAYKRLLKAEGFFNKDDFC